MAATAADRLPVRQLRDGERHIAGGRSAAASDQLWRHVDGHVVGGLRHIDVVALASQAHRILGACLSIPRGRDRDGFAFSRGGADAVGL